MSNPVGCRRKQPVFFDVLILPVRVVDGVVTPSAETKVSLQKKRRGCPNVSDSPIERIGCLQP